MLEIATTEYFFKILIVLTTHVLTTTKKIAFNFSNDNNKNANKANKSRIQKSNNENNFFFFVFQIQTKKHKTNLKQFISITF